MLVVPSELGWEVRPVTEEPTGLLTHGRGWGDGVGGGRGEGRLDWGDLARLRVGCRHHRLWLRLLALSPRPPEAVPLEGGHLLE